MLIRTNNWDVETYRKQVCKCYLYLTSMSSLMQWLLLWLLLDWRGSWIPVLTIRSSGVSGIWNRVEYFCQYYVRITFWKGFGINTEFLGSNHKFWMDILTYLLINWNTCLTLIWWRCRWWDPSSWCCRFWIIGAIIFAVRWWWFFRHFQNRIF